MTLPLIIAFLAYVLSAVYVSRKTVGHWAYRKWVHDRRHYRVITPAAFEDFSYDEGEAFVGAFFLSLCFLPIMAVLVLAYDRGGTLRIDPKHVRQKREIAAYQKRIAELESVTGVN